MVVVMITTTTVAVIFRNVIVNLLIYHLFSTDRFIVGTISLNIIMIIVLIVTVLIAVIVCISITSILVMSGADGAEGCGDPAGALQCLISPSYCFYIYLAGGADHAGKCPRSGYPCGTAARGDWVQGLWGLCSLGFGLLILDPKL